MRFLSKYFLHNEHFKGEELEEEEEEHNKSFQAS